ncbi:MAG: 30S ribosomal protein S7 [Puniceicoccales bacterium]|jgi:small subunit ribosomal protein S7|nr:30S ribosomal protein S7 [Puniceicoccales bacterium]
MSRRRRAEKREFAKDPRFGSALIGQLVSIVMERGKRSLACSIVYGAIERASEALEKGDPVELLLGVLENARPKVEVKSRRVGGATYQVPVEVPYVRQQSLVFRWLVEAAKSRKGKGMREALGQEIIDAYNNAGNVVKKKVEIHRMAQANRAFAHFVW